MRSTSLSSVTLPPRGVRIALARKSSKFAQSMKCMYGRCTLSGMCTMMDRMSSRDSQSEHVHRSKWMNRGERGARLQYQAVVKELRYSNRPVMSMHTAYVITLQQVFLPSLYLQLNIQYKHRRWISGASVPATNRLLPPRAFACWPRRCRPFSYPLLTNCAVQRVILRLRLLCLMCTRLFCIFFIWFSLFVFIVLLLEAYYYR